MLKTSLKNILQAKFQCSSASRKFLNQAAAPSMRAEPQFQCSSASRKFLNSITVIDKHLALRVSVLFSEPKIPQSDAHCGTPSSKRCFSALQRAENSSMLSVVEAHLPAIAFQCSSASRKFLNFDDVFRLANALQGFSALQRAENSSIVLDGLHALSCADVSVLFSEPKIPQ